MSDRELWRGKAMRHVDRIQNESWGRAVVGDEQVEEDHVIP